MSTPAAHNRPADTAPSADRAPLLDALRLIGALGVVWLHTLKAESFKHAEVLGRFGVPLFAGAAAYFCVAGALRRPKPMGPYVAARAWRLLVPFAAWALVYAAARYVKPMITGGPSNLSLSYPHLYNGTALHLWFLPFIFLATVALHAMTLGVRGSAGARRALAGGLILTGLAAMLAPVSWLDGVTAPWNLHPDAFYLFSTGFNAGGTLLWGAAMALLLDGRAVHDAVGPGWRGVGISAVVVAAGVTVAGLWLGRTNWAENLAGFLLLLAGLMPFDAPWIRRLAGLGAAAFGAYLCHILFVDAMQAVGPKLVARFVKDLGATGTWWWDVLSFVVASVCAVLTAVALKRFRSTAWLAG